MREILRADVDGVGVGDRAAVMAGDRGEDLADILRLHQRDQADPLAVDDPGRLEPAEIDRVVDVPERVLIAPEDGQGDDDGVFVELARCFGSIGSSRFPRCRSTPARPPSGRRSMRRCRARRVGLKAAA